MEYAVIDMVKKNNNKGEISKYLGIENKELELICKEEGFKKV